MKKHVFVFHPNNHYGDPIKEVMEFSDDYTEKHIEEEFNGWVTEQYDAYFYESDDE